MDLQAGELLPDDVDPIEVSEELVRRYRGLWEELNQGGAGPPEDQRHRIAKRLRRLNELGFDADEVELIDGEEGTGFGSGPGSPSPGIAAASCSGRPGSAPRSTRPAGCSTTSPASAPTRSRSPVGRSQRTVAAHRWLEEVYDPVVEAIPDGLRGRLAPPEIFHEILEHRWYMSEAAGRDVGTTAAARSYFDTVLPAVPQPIAPA